MRKLLFLLALIVGIGCEGPEPRKPIQRKSGSFFKQSVERNRKLLLAEEQKIKKIIENDSLKHYINSAAGSWYHYLVVNDTAKYTPKPDDIVTMTYDILSLENDTIYSENDIGNIAYRVDKEELFQGLRDAVKLLKENEKATFLFPSSLAYGYHGDNNKIGTNVPLKSTITILKIEKSGNNNEN
ncbi:gliding motility-associated peptidyl-prolyl isomerase GldI [Maribacter aestuarii]|uniref:gliding motility-associated peptidyl-prolyl isomerase GldI n=1 Tax=Maribacter aestuarii TaxID=1130723 RepID=UPI00248D0808|nr:gliding motility-associated peptidyl-prolyl isomerase GldI [Maribacter aestuarii]